MSTSSFQSFGKLTALVVVALLAGCKQSQDATVTGRVTLDGQPLDHGAVVFKADDSKRATVAAGDIARDGSYLVQIGQSGKMISGEYQVEVSARGPATPHPQGGPPTPGQLITPARYASCEASTLRYFIRPGDNVIDIALVSDPPVDAETPEEGDAVEQVETAEDLVDEASVDEDEEVSLPEDASEEPSGEIGDNQQAAQE